jgi:hypothetical protein
MTTRTCTVDGCNRPHDARGYCNTHYRRWRLYGDPLEPSHVATRGVCSFDGCTNAHRSQGFCSTHYKQARREGTVTKVATRGSRALVDVAARIEDVEWMVYTGENLNGAAERIGIEPDSLAKWLSDNGRPDLRTKLLERNPRALEDGDLKERRVAAWHESRKRKRQVVA